MQTRGVTPLSIASYYGRAETVKALLDPSLDKRADVDEIAVCLLPVESDIAFCSVMSPACLVGFLPASRVLFHWTQVGGLSPLFLASENDHADTVKALLDGGANANQTSVRVVLSMPVSAVKTLRNRLQRAGG